MVARPPTLPLERSAPRSSSSSPSAPAPKRLKGVRKRSWGKWVSEIRLPNTRARLWLGSYATAEQAARAFDVAVVCLRGRSASLNFPDSPPAFAPLGLPHHQIQALAAAAAVDHASTPAVIPPAEFSYCEFPAPSPENLLNVPDGTTSSSDANAVCNQAAVLTNTADESADLRELRLLQDENSSVLCLDASVQEELQQMGNGDFWNELPLWEHSCALDSAFVPPQLSGFSCDNDEYGGTGGMADPHVLWSL